jgi:nucleotide-binding universal stress UspA family protein
MRLFHNILLVASGGKASPALLDRAVRLAKRSGARLTLIDVVEALSRDLRKLFPQLPVQELRRLALERRRQELERLAASAGERGVPTSTKVLWGAASREIVHEVVAGDHDLVLVNAASDKRPLVGSTATDLMQTCPCPVWSVPPAAGNAAACILAVVDPDPEDVRRYAMSRKVLDLASALARLDDSELHVAHVWSVFAEQILRGRARLSAQEVDRIVEEARVTAVKRVEGILALHRLSLTGPSVHLLKGQPELEVPRLANSLDVGVLVIGTAVETRLARLLTGDAAERILQATNCTVLTLRPDTYVPPSAFELTPPLWALKAS